MSGRVSGLLATGAFRLAAHILHGSLGDHGALGDGAGRDRGREGQDGGSLEVHYAKKLEYYMA